MPLRRNDIAIERSVTIPMPSIDVGNQGASCYGQLQYPSTVPVCKRELVLTIDDGPRWGTSNLFLNTLKEHHIKAIFFVVGKDVKRNKHLIREIAQQGHYIGNHSYTHPRQFNELAADDAIREFDACDYELRDTLGTSSSLLRAFRFPGLQRNRRLEQHLINIGVSIWSADIVVDDWLRLDPQACALRGLTRVARAQKGIILVHCNKLGFHSSAIFIKELYKRRYKFIDISSIQAEARSHDM